MRIFTFAEWEKQQYRGQWSDSPFNRDRVECGELPAYYINRRNLMVNDHDGAGCKLITEGVHFLVDGDYGYLPILTKENALEGAAYRFGNSYLIVNRIYRISDEYAKENQLAYLDRAETSIGDFALLSDV